MRQRMCLMGLGAALVIPQYERHDNAAHAGSITWNTYNRIITTSWTPNSHIMNPGTILLGVHRTNAHWRGYSEGRAEERMSQVLLSCFRGSCRYLAENVGGWRGGYPRDRKKDQDADDAFPSIARSIFSNAFSMISPAMTCAV